MASTHTQGPDDSRFYVMMLALWSSSSMAAHFYDLAFCFLSVRIVLLSGDIGEVLSPFPEKFSYWSIQGGSSTVVLLSLCTLMVSREKLACSKSALTLPGWFTLLTILRRWSRCKSYSLLLCGLFYAAICFMSYLVSFCCLFDLCLFGFVGFLFLLVSGKGCGLWLWHSLDFSLTFFFPYVAFVWSLFIIHFSFWGIGRAVLCHCGLFCGGGVSRIFW